MRKPEGARRPPGALGRATRTLGNQQQSPQPQAEQVHASPQQEQDALLASPGFVEQHDFLTFTPQQSPQPQAVQVQASPQQMHGAALALPPSARVLCPFDWAPRRPPKARAPTTLSI